MTQSVLRWPGWPKASWPVSALVWPAGPQKGLSPVFGTGEAKPSDLCPVLGFLGAEIEVAGVCPEKGNEADGGPRVQLL